MHVHMLSTYLLTCYRDRAIVIDIGITVISIRVIYVIISTNTIFTIPVTVCPDTINISVVNNIQYYRHF